MHGTLRFLFLFHLLYGKWVEIFTMNQYISKSNTTTKNTVDRQYTERGAAVVSTITSSNTIRSLQSANGKKMSTNVEILDEAKNYYEPKKKCTFI